MNDPKQELIEKLKGASNILVTVSSNPSVDQLAACIGLTIMLNKLKKHATAVFSGNIPSTIEFLKPDETLEKNTDSLRDFIIALDKSKADKLRYKVEENVVKIFITPYKTSITQEDLDFSQGDFNVDVVLTLGVQEQKDLDQAITAHGRILHDATVASVNLQPGSELGIINWTEPAASSLSELAVEMVNSLGQDQMDAQIATALLTGIVAETERFSNEKTSPETMKLSAELMTAGANQQLVANELQAAQVVDHDTDEPAKNEATQPDDGKEDKKPKSDDGTLEITHTQSDEPTPTAELPKPSEPKQPAEQPQHNYPDQTTQAPETVDADGAADLFPHSDTPPQPAIASPHRIIEPPTMGGQLTANTQPEGLEGSVDPLSPTSNLHDNTTGDSVPLLQHTAPESSEHSAEPALPTIPLPEPIGDMPSASESAVATDYQPLDVASAGAVTTPAPEPPKPADLPFDINSQQIHIDPDGNLQMPDSPASAQPSVTNPAPLVAMPEPPTTGADNDNDQTLSALEQSVHSPHVEDDGGNVDAARNAVMDAINSVPAEASQLPAKQDVGASGYLNVQDLPDTPDTPQPPAGPGPLTDFSTPAPTAAPVTPNMTNEPAPSMSPADTPLTMPLPPTFTMPAANPLPPTSTTNDPAAPPPVPPPMTDLPPFSPPPQQ